MADGTLEQRVRALAMSLGLGGRYAGRSTEREAVLLAFAREERARGLERAIELCGEPDCPACERIRVEAHAERGGSDG